MKIVLGSWLVGCWVRGALVSCSNVYVCGRRSMASLRLAHLLFRSNVLSVRTLRIPQKTLWTLSGRGWAARVRALTAQHSLRHAGSNPPRQSLAEELLAAKVKGGQEGQEAQAEQDSEKSQQEREKTYKTLKYSFLGFGVMMTGMGGFLIWSWGECGGNTHTLYMQSALSIYHSLHTNKDVSRL